ncbi:MAG TPA: hypothetical protein VGP58_00530, partial [Pyrinomonadaceae bacterium]|nr:hypothetical protein [Pyrinomonadaceae bacterium]
LVLCGICETISDSKFQISELLSSGKALEKFKQNIELQGGDMKVCDDPEILLDKTLMRVEIKSNQTGFIEEVDALTIGESIVNIGGGRTKAEDAIDHAVGFACEKKIGDEIEKHETLGILYCRNQTQADSVSEKLRDAYKISNEKTRQTKLIKEII